MNRLKTRVINIKTETCKSSDYVYIGRPSIWGNPFSITENCRRSESLRRFFKYLQNHPKLVEQTLELSGKILGCYCAPLPCHGHILAALADGEKWEYRTVSGTEVLRRRQHEQSIGTNYRL